MGRRPLPFLAALLVSAWAHAAPWTDAQRLDEARLRLAEGDPQGAVWLADDVLAGRPEPDTAIEARGLRALGLLATAPERARDDLHALVDAPGLVGLDARWRLVLLDLDAGHTEAARAALPALGRALPPGHPARARIRLATAIAATAPAPRVTRLAGVPGLPLPDRSRATLVLLDRAARRAAEAPTAAARHQVRERVQQAVALGDPTTAVRALLRLADVDAALGAADAELRDLDLAVQAARLAGVDPAWRRVAFTRFEKATSPDGP